MTEGEWNSCAAPPKMLEWLRTLANPSERKLRLFGVACCLRVSHVNTHPGAGQAVEVAERLADGRATEQERLRAWRGANAKQYGDLTTWSAAFGAVKKQAFLAARHASSRAAYDRAAGLHGDEYSKTWRGEKRLQAELLRCVFGNPFRRPMAAIEPAWLAWNGGIVRRLAAAIYEERALPQGTLDRNRLAVLADALEESGCTNEELLGHLRGPGPHVRGCWPIDLLLGKS